MTPLPAVPQGGPHKDTDRSTAAPVPKTAGSPAGNELPGRPGDLLPRGRFGRFVLERELGRGGMGIVYLARDEKLGGPVALKVLRSEGTSPNLLKRFFREAQATASLRHPGIVRLLDVGENEGRHWYSMEYVDGKSLHAALKDPLGAGLCCSAGGLEPRTAAKLMHKVAQAVEHAHERGLIHRDLKPGNVLLDRAGAVKVADFGLAKDLALSHEEAQLTARLTLTGMVIGTPGYMAPEQAGGEIDRIGPHSDVYSLGAMLFELLTRRLPFAGTNAAQILMQQTTRAAPSLRNIDRSIPQALDTICGKAVEQAPADRYASAGAMARDLALFLEGKPILAQPRGVWDKGLRLARRNRAAAVATGGLACLALSGAAYAYWLGRVPEPWIANTSNVAVAKPPAPVVLDSPQDVVSAVNLDRPANALLTGLDPALRKTVEQRVQALHSRLVDRLAQEKGRFITPDRIGASGAVWTGTVLEATADFVVVDCEDGSTATARWSNVSADSYIRLVSCIIPVASAQDFFDVGALALYLGARSAAIRDLWEARERATADQASLLNAADLILVAITPRTDEMPETPWSGVSQQVDEVRLGPRRVHDSAVSTRPSAARSGGSDRGLFPGGGRYGGRRLADRENLVARGGGTRATESAVLAALRWLARHQSEDGGWKADQYHAQCTGSKCEGTGYIDYDTGLTGLSLLAFLGAGYTHLSHDEISDPATGKVLKFGEVVKKGVKWMIKNQDADGLIGPKISKYMYNHAIAALAISEGYGMTQSPILKDPAQKGIDYLMAAKNPSKAWRYSFKCGENDSSVTGWCVMALKSAEISGLNMGHSAMEESKSFISEVTETNYGKCGYQKMEDAGVKVVVQGKNDEYTNHEVLTAVGMCVRVFVDKDIKDPMLDLGARCLVGDLPVFDKVKKTNDYYYWYYGTLALFQFDGPDSGNKGKYWKPWNKALVEALVKNQHTRSSGCADGSWDSDDRWGFEGGRVYAVALNALSLEIYYRYANVFGGNRGSGAKKVEGGEGK